MRSLSLLSILAGLVLIIANPVQADTDRDYIENKLDEWIQYAENLGYEVIESDIGTVDEDSIFYYGLGPGRYHAYSESSEGITDLDMTARDDWGNEIAGDTMADSFPVLEFRLNDWQEVEFEIDVYASEGDYGRGYYCFVLAREPDYSGGWYSDDYQDTTDRDRNRDRDRDRDRDRWGSDESGGDGFGHRNDWGEYSNEWQDWWQDWDDGRRCDGSDNWSGNQRRRYMEDKLDYLYEFASHRGLSPIMDGIDEIEDTRTYSITLHRGYYVVFAAGGPWIDDLDLSVTWRDDWSVAEDIGIDSAPAVWFYVPNRTTIDIEVEAWAYKGFHDSDYVCILVCEG